MTETATKPEFTEQQIEQHCKDLERCQKLTDVKAAACYLPTSLQIIRQLQGSVHECAGQGQREEDSLPRQR